MDRIKNIYYISIHNGKYQCHMAAASCTYYLPSSASCSTWAIRKKTLTFNQKYRWIFWGKNLENGPFGKKEQDRESNETSLRRRGRKGKPWDSIHIKQTHWHTVKLFINSHKLAALSGIFICTSQCISAHNFTSSIKKHLGFIPENIWFCTLTFLHNLHSLIHIKLDEA